MNDQLLARVQHVTVAIRAGTYVSRDVLQELVTDIHDDAIFDSDTKRVDFLKGLIEERGTLVLAWRNPEGNVSLLVSHGVDLETAVRVKHSARTSCDDRETLRGSIDKLMEEAQAKDEAQAELPLMPDSE